MKKKLKISRLIMISAALLLYIPFVFNLYDTYKIKRDLEEININDFNELDNFAEIYNEKENDDSFPDPFKHEIYAEKIEGLSDNFPYAVLYVEKIGIDLPIIVNSGNINYAASRIPGSSFFKENVDFPVIVAARRNLFYAKRFKYLDLLEKGDRVKILRENDTLSYKVKETGVRNISDYEKAVYDADLCLISEDFSKEDSRIIVKCDFVEKIPAEIHYPKYSLVSIFCVLLISAFISTVIFKYFLD